MEVFAVLASVQSMGLTGIQGYPVTVEAYCVDGMPMFEIVGLPDAAVKESRERVRAAMSACRMQFPVARLTLNLAPADVRKVARTFADLAGAEEIGRAHLLEALRYRNLEGNYWK